jgi:hypothetical protein
MNGGEGAERLRSRKISNKWVVGTNQFSLHPIGSTEGDAPYPARMPFDLEGAQPIFAFHHQIHFRLSA